MISQIEIQSSGRTYINSMRIRRLLGFGFILALLVMLINSTMSWLQSDLLENAMSVAVRRQDAAAVEKAISRGGNARMLNSEDDPIIFWAVRYGDLRTTQALIAHGADADSRSHSGETLLMHAAGRVNTAILQLLLDAGASIDARDAFGFTALMYAIRARQGENVKIILDHGAGLDYTSVDGATAASLAMECGDSTIIDLIKRRSGDQVRKSRVKSDMAN